MNKLITFATLLLVITIGTSQSPTGAETKIFPMEEPIAPKEYTVTHEDYTLHFKFEKSKDQQNILEVSVELHNNSYFVSPNAKRDFSGKFRRDFGDTKNIDYDGDLIETPLSVEEFDEHPFVGGTVNWVRINTTYKQPLTLKTDKDFQVFGRFIFTIEPRCTLETVPFSIVHKDGELTFVDPKC